MRHRVKGRHLARTAEHRRALYRNLIGALFEHGRIRTTDAKAREIRPMAEKMITLGKRGDLHARRLAARTLGDGTALQRLFGPIAERFAERPGGYTRMIKAGRRHGDAAPLAYLELLDEAPRVVRRTAEGEEEAGPKEEKGSGTRRAGRRPAGKEGAAQAAPKAKSGSASSKSRAGGAGEASAAKGKGAKKAKPAEGKTVRRGSAKHSSDKKGEGE